MLYFFIALVAIEIVYFRIARYYNIIDKPNSRSSHSVVTLRGGGIIFYFGVLLFSLTFYFPYPWFLAGLTLVAVISFLDDIKPRPAKIRLTIHFLAMFLMFYQWDLFQMPWYFTVISLVICTGILNAWNFMDGINGITGGYSMAVLGAFWYINNFEISFADNNLILLVLMSLIVFNLFNFRKKAKCFAGDVGSFSIAFVIVFLLGRLIMQTGDFSYIILLAVYGVDSILTIIHRLILKENIFEAHRKHAYQIMANELKINHLQIAGLYLVLQSLVNAGYFTMPLRFRWYYLSTVLLLLIMSYVLFMKKFFLLHKQKMVS